MNDTENNISQLISEYISYLEIEKGLSKNTILILLKMHRLKKSKEKIFRLIQNI